MTGLIAGRGPHRAVHHDRPDRPTHPYAGHRAPRIARTLAQTRSSFAGQLRSHFSPELGELTPARAEDLVALIDGLTSFEAWDLQHSGFERSDRQIRRAWVAGVRALVREVGSFDAGPRRLPHGDTTLVLDELTAPVSGQGEKSRPRTSNRSDVFAASKNRERVKSFQLAS